MIIPHEILKYGIPRKQRSNPGYRPVYLNGNVAIFVNFVPSTFNFLSNSSCRPAAVSGSNPVTNSNSHTRPHPLFSGPMRWAIVSVGHRGYELATKSISSGANKTVFCRRYPKPPLNAEHTFKGIEI